MPVGAWFGHSYCLLCKSRNLFSLGLEFHADGHGEVFASFQGRPFLQGYDGISHGGMIYIIDKAAAEGLKCKEAELKKKSIRIIDKTK